MLRERVLQREGEAGAYVYRFLIFGGRARPVRENIILKVNTFDHHHNSLHESLLIRAQGPVHRYGQRKDGLGNRECAPILADFRLPAVAMMRIQVP